MGRDRESAQRNALAEQRGLHYHRVTALRDEIDPTIAAISTLMTAVSFMLVLVATSRSKKGA